MLVQCMLCRKECDVQRDDPQYRKLLAKETKLYICKTCNTAGRMEAVQSSGINPEMLDPDKYDKYIP